MSAPAIPSFDEFSKKQATSIPTFEEFQRGGSPKVTPPEPPVSPVDRMAGGVGQGIAGAIDLGKGAIKGIGRQAYDTMTGYLNPIGAPIKAVAERTGIGPKIESATEPSNTMQKIGGYLPDVAMAIAPAGEAISVIPRTARAVKNFDIAKSIAGKVPVDVGHFAQDAIRAQRINDIAGDPLPPVIGRALEHINPHVGEPLNYEDLRTMASSAGRKAQQQAMGNTMTGEMGHRLNAVGRGMDVAASEAAHKAGVGSIHDAAMQEYAAAQRGKDIAKKTAQIAVPAAIGTGMAYKGLKGFGYLGD